MYTSLQFGSKNQQASRKIILSKELRSQARYKCFKNLAEVTSTGGKTGSPTTCGMTADANKRVFERKSAAVYISTNPVKATSNKCA